MRSKKAVSQQNGSILRRNSSSHQQALLLLARSYNNSANARPLSRHARLTSASCGRTTAAPLPALDARNAGPLHLGAIHSNIVVSYEETRAEEPVGWDDARIASQLFMQCTTACEASVLVGHTGWDARHSLSWREGKAIETALHAFGAVSARVPWICVCISCKQQVMARLSHLMFPLPFLLRLRSVC